MDAYTGYCFQNSEELSGNDLDRIHQNAYWGGVYYRFCFTDYGFDHFLTSDLGFLKLLRTRIFVNICIPTTDFLHGSSFKN